MGKNKKRKQNFDVQQVGQTICIVKFEKYLAMLTLAPYL